MKQIALITLLCLLTSVSQATFELEDPAQMVKELEIQLAEENSAINDAADYAAEAEVIVPANTDLYIPSITGGECDGWSFDKSEPYVDENQQTKYTSKTTYIGHSVKTIDCKTPDGTNTLQLLLIKTKKGRLIWVESGKELSSD